MKLIIRNLARTTSEEELLAMFKEHGGVQYCNLVMDEKTGQSKGFAFVEMPKQGEAKVAMKALNGKVVADSKIRVKKAEAKKESNAKPKAEQSAAPKQSKPKENPWAERSKN